MNIEKRVPESLSRGADREKYQSHLDLIHQLDEKPEILQNYDSLKEVKWQKDGEVLCTAMYIEEGSKMVIIKELGQKKAIYLNEENQINEFFNLWCDVIFLVTRVSVAAEPVS